MENHFRTINFKEHGKMHRKWSEAQKLQVIQEVEQIVLTETLRK